MADKRVSLYVGYYEVLLTRQCLGEPYALAGHFKSIGEAVRYAEDCYPSADILPLEGMRAEYDGWRGVPEEVAVCGF